MTRSAMLTIALVVIVAPLLHAQAIPNKDRWEPVIKQFEANDRLKPPPAGGVVFVGSSSIRLWKLADSFPGMEVLNRGFGGSILADSARYADRIVTPYKPRAIVVYAGDNDLAGGRTPEQVRDAYREFVANVRAKLPKTPIIFISIKPCLSRWKHVEQVKAANRLIIEAQRGDPTQKFVDVFTPMLGTDGKPRPELFLKDQLHMNEKGYKIWTDLVKPLLQP